MSVYRYPKFPEPRIFKFIYGATPEELAIQLQHAKDKAMSDSNSTAANWKKQHGEGWKQVWKECFGVSFDKHVESQRNMQLMTWEEFRIAKRQALIDPLKHCR